MVQRGEESTYALPSVFDLHDCSFLLTISTVLDIFHFHPRR